MAFDAATFAKQLSHPDAAATMYQFRHVREEEQSRNESFFGYPHISPGSVLIAPIGTMWERGSWEAVANMAYETRKAGYNVGLEEMKDGRATMPYAAVGAMRDQAAMTAQTRGVEWFCMLDNDALPTPTMLIDLITADLPVIGPRVVTMDGTFVGAPEWKLGTGVRPAKWLPFSFLLMRTAVLNCVPNPFNYVGPEGNFFMRLWLHGHRAYMHTDLEMRVVTPPSLGFETWERWQDKMQKVDRRRREAPDRTPVLSTTPNVAGVAMPWAREMNGATPA